MRQSAISRVLYPILAIVLAFAAPAFAQDDMQDQLDGWHATLDQIAAILLRPTLRDNQLVELRTSALSVHDQARLLAARLRPRIAAVEARLRSLALDTEIAVDQLPEPEAIRVEREREEDQLGRLTGLIRQADLAALRADQLVSTISDRRNQQFTSQLFERSDHLWSPTLWRSIASELPKVTSEIAFVLGDWVDLIAARADRPTIALLILLAILVPLAVWIARRSIRRFVEGLADRSTPTDDRKVTTAAGIVAGHVVIPTVALLAAMWVLETLGFLPNAIRASLIGLLVAVLAFATINGLALALLAPARPDWRLVTLENSVARRLYGAALVVALLAATLPFIDHMTGLTAADPSLALGLGGTIAFAIAVTVIVGARTIARDGKVRAEAGVSESIGRIWRWAITLAGATAVAAILAAVTGYVAIARFLSAQIVWTGVVVALLALTSRLADVVAARVFSADRSTGRWLMASLGFSRNAVTQAGIMVGGIARLLLVILAIVAIAAPWGFDTISIAESLVGLFHGVTIGSITITYSTILAALLLFVVGIVATRLIQTWLDTRLLPNTDLDPGLRSSIRTGIGYLGVIIAAIVAGAYVGLDFASVALIAGALSVGIGFGLQSIVNNFVSGLILLAERPIRPGDWIDVEGNEGTVTRINVRSTELQTFDRATVIIPNSSLIAGVVTNKYLHERLGRIIVPVGVSYGSDADQVRTLLLECARDHPKILDTPEPHVLFTDFGASALDFELRAYLADVSDSLTVRSDLRFAILGALRAANIDIPFPQRDINLRDLPRIEKAIADVTALGDRDNARQR